MKTAIHFGAGNIGRGFIGLLLHKAQYHVTFVDVQQNILDAINEHKKYTIEIVGTNKESIIVDNVSATHSQDEKLLQQISDAEIITTAVGPNVLKHLAPVIAKAIETSVDSGRDKPLNIIACENAVRASSSLKQDVLSQLTIDLPNWVGFVDSAVDRIVPPMPESSDHHILDVRVEEFSEWLVEASGIVGSVPDIDGMDVVENLNAGIERKLFTLNTGHAICAWLGQHNQYGSIRDSILDANIKSHVYGAMVQSGDALIQRHGFDKSAHESYIAKILNRFENPYIDDSVNRVGRQPVRKLSPKERIVSPVETALSYNLPVNELLLGAAAAMKFKSSEDPQSIELLASIKKDGVEATFSRISGLNDLSSQVNTYYQTL